MKSSLLRRHFKRSQPFVFFKFDTGKVYLCSTEGSSDFELLGYDLDTPVLSTKLYGSAETNLNNKTVIETNVKGEKLFIVNNRTGKKIEVPVSRCKIVPANKVSESDTTTNSDYELYTNNDLNFSTWAKHQLLEPEVDKLKPIENVRNDHTYFTKPTEPVLTKPIYPNVVIRDIIRTSIEQVTQKTLPSSSPSTMSSSTPEPNLQSLSLNLTPLDMSKPLLLPKPKNFITPNFKPNFIKAKHARDKSKTKVMFHRFIQTSPLTTVDVGCNTDDTLIEFLIDEKTRERRNRVELRPISSPQLIEPSAPTTPFQIDDKDIVNSLQFNGDDLILPNSFVSFLDEPQGISIGATFDPVLNFTTRPLNALQFGGLESWKARFFYDLKRCIEVEPDGNYPIHVAVIQDNISAVKRQCLALKLRKISVDMINERTQTALQMALIHNSRLSIVETLIGHGADSKVMDREGNNVLHLAIKYSNEPVVRLLLSSINIKIDLDENNYDGFTPLMLATFKRQIVMMKALLCCGANPNICDKRSGRTALFHAIDLNDVSMVQLLLKFKASTKIKNYFGTSPHNAMYEMESVDLDIKKLILNKDRNQLKKSKASKRKRKLTEMDYL